MATYHSVRTRHLAPLSAPRRTTLVEQHHNLLSTMRTNATACSSTASIAPSGEKRCRSAVHLCAAQVATLAIRATQRTPSRLRAATRQTDAWVVHARYARGATPPRYPLLPHGRRAPVSLLDIFSAPQHHALQRTARKTHAMQCAPSSVPTCAAHKCTSERHSPRR